MLFRNYGLWSRCAHQRGVITCRPAQQAELRNTRTYTYTHTHTLATVLLTMYLKTLDPVSLPPLPIQYYSVHSGFLFPLL